MRSLEGRLTFRLGEKGRKQGPQMKSLKFMPSIMFLALLGSTLLLQGCGKGSTVDSGTRQKNREHEVSNTLTTEFDSIAGNYKGVITSKTPITVNDDVKDQYTIEANFHTIQVNKDTNIIPQPTVTGTITLINRSKKQITAEGKEIQQLTPFPFQTGSYDKNKLKLTAEIQGLTAGNTAIYVACLKKSEQATHFECHWKSVVSDTQFDFNLDKI